MKSSYLLDVPNLYRRYPLFGTVPQVPLFSALLSQKHLQPSPLQRSPPKSFVPNIAIVAVGVDQLFQVSKDLINAGTKRILIEKFIGWSLTVERLSLPGQRGTREGYQCTRPEILRSFLCQKW